MSSTDLGEKPVETQLERVSSGTGSAQIEDEDPIVHWRTWLVVCAASFTYLGQGLSRLACCEA